MSSTRQLIVYIWIGLLFIQVVRMTLMVHGLYLGQETVRFEKELNRLQVENTDLERDVANYSSLRYAAEEAMKSGFIKPRSDQIIKLK